MPEPSPFSLVATRKRPANIPCSPGAGLTTFAEQHTKIEKTKQQDLIKQLELLRGQSLSTYESWVYWWRGTAYTQEQLGKYTEQPAPSP